MRLRVAMVTKNFLDVPYWAALDHGWFGVEGLDVELVVLDGVRQVTEALREGAVELGIGSSEHVLDDARGGGPLRLLAGNINTLTHSLIVQPEYAALEQLRGATIGVSTFGVGTASVLHAVLATVGLTFPEDYRLVEVGAVPDRHELLLSRRIDAGMQTFPYDHMAQQAGLRSLGHVSQWIPDFQFASVNARVDWAQSHAEDLRAFLRVAIRASRWIYEDRDGAVDTARRHMGLSVHQLEAAWDDNLRTRAIPEDLRLSRAGLEFLVGELFAGLDGTSGLSVDVPAGRATFTGPLTDAQRDLGLSPVALG